MTLNGAIMQLVELSEHPMMPVIFRPLIQKVIETISELEEKPEIIRCKDCKYWHSGSCEYPEHVVNSQDYYVGDIETEAEHFCGYAERRWVTT